MSKPKVSEFGISLTKEMVDKTYRYQEFMKCCRSCDHFILDSSDGNNDWCEITGYMASDKGICACWEPLKELKVTK